MTNQLASREEYLLRQRVTLMVNRYEVFAPASPGSKEETDLLAFVEQKRMKLKEEIVFFSDAAKTTELFRVKADKVFDPSGSYQLLDPAGAVIARFKKRFGKSLLQSTYILMDANGTETGMAKERNLFAALLRRFGGFIPYVGDLITMLIAYNFDFTDANDRRQAVVEKIWSIRDRYRITVTDEGKGFDRRLLIAMAVCMDALQAR